MGWVYQNEQKCMFIFWSWRAIPWSVTNAEMHSAFPLWDSLGRELCVLLCFSRKAARWLTGDPTMCDTLKCHFTAFNGKLLPTSLVQPAGSDSSPQTAPSESCCTAPEPFQGKVECCTCPAASPGLKHFHLFCRRPHHCKWSTEVMGSLSVTPSASWEGVKVVSHPHLNLHSLLSTEFYYSKKVLTLHCEQQKLYR